MCCIINDDCVRAYTFNASYEGTIDFYLCRIINLRYQMLCYFHTAQLLSS